MFDLILQWQNKLLQISPSLIPLVGILYSLVTSPHCTLMCTPFLPTFPSEKNSFYWGRAIVYSILGGLFGAFGSLLKKSLEFELISIFGFLFFAVITIFVMGWQIFPSLKFKFKFNFFKSPKQANEKGFYRGILMGFMPCHSLYFFYALAAITTSSLGGVILLFGHALATMPALAYGRTFLEKMFIKYHIHPWIFRWLILFLTLFNLFYFAARLFYSEETAQSRVLFCF